MTVAKTQFKVPTVPGVDLSDKKVMSGAKRVATRTNNDYKRAVLKKAPLFADTLLAEYDPMTPEKVVARRIEFRAGFKEWKRDFNDLVRGHIRGFRAEVRALVPDDAEFRRLMRHCIRMRGGDRSSKWSRTLTLVKKRAEQPLSPTAELVLAWLETEEKPVTQFDLWAKRGDGLSAAEILKALMELSDYAYAGTVDLVNLPEKYHRHEGWNVKTAWTWEAIKIAR